MQSLRKDQNEASICEIGFRGNAFAEKSLIGAYSNKLFDFGKRHSLFSCYGQIKPNSAAKELHIKNLNT